MICITHIRTYPIRTSHASKYSKWFYLLRAGSDWWWYITRAIDICLHSESQ